MFVVVYIYSHSWNPSRESDYSAAADDAGGSGPSCISAAGIMCPAISSLSFSLDYYLSLLLVGGLVQSVSVAE